MASSGIRFAGPPTDAFGIAASPASLLGHNDSVLSQETAQTRPPGSPPENKGALLTGDSTNIGPGASAEGYEAMALATAASPTPTVSVHPAPRPAAVSASDVFYNTASAPTQDQVSGPVIKYSDYVQYWRWGWVGCILGAIAFTVGFTLLGLFGADTTSRTTFGVWGVTLLFIGFLFLGIVWHADLSIKGKTVVPDNYGQGTSSVPQRRRNFFAPPPPPPLSPMAANNENTMGMLPLPQYRESYGDELGGVALAAPVPKTATAVN